MSVEVKSVKSERYEIGPKIEMFIANYFPGGRDVAFVDLEVTYKDLIHSEWRFHHISKIKLVEDVNGLSVIGLDYNDELVTIFGKDENGLSINPTFIYDNNHDKDKNGLEEQNKSGVQFAPTKEIFIQRVFSPGTSYFIGVSDFKARFIFKDEKGLTSHVDIINVTLENDQVYGYDRQNIKREIYTDKISPYGISENHHNASLQDAILTAISRVLRKHPFLDRLRRK